MIMTLRHAIYVGWVLRDGEATGTCWDVTGTGRDVMGRDKDETGRDRQGRDGA